MNPKLLNLAFKGASMLAEHEAKHGTLSKRRDKIDAGLAAAEQGISIARSVLNSVPKDTSKLK